MVNAPLGMGNYLAAFLVFLFNVAMHCKSWLAVLLAVLTLATFSRTGVVALVASVLILAISETSSLAPELAGLPPRGCAS